MMPRKLRSTSKQKGAPLQSRKIPANTQASAARHVSKSRSPRQMQKHIRRKKSPKTVASKNEQNEESIQGASGNAIIYIHCFLIDGVNLMLLQFYTFHSCDSYASIECKGS